MAYGEIKVDTVTFTDGGIDKSVSISGLVQNPTFSGNITVTGTISGNTVQGQTVSGVTVTGTTANFVSGVFTTQISGATITGNVGSFTTITGGTVTLTSGVFASGTAAAPSVSIGTTDNGLYSPGTDQVAVATNGTGRLFVDASGNVGVGTSSVNALLEVNNSTAGGEVQRIEGNYDGSGSVILTNWRRAGGSVAAALKYNDDSSPLCMSIGTTTSHEFRIRTADTDAITIDASQRVGIGTSSPNVPLDIESSAGTAVKIRLASNTSNRALAFSNAAETIGWTVGNGVIASARQFVVYDNEAGAARLLIDSSGNVGIGTTTVSDKLHVADGNITFSYADGSTGLRNKISWRTESPFFDETAYIAVNRTGVSGAPADIVLATGGAGTATEKARLTSAGLVGIGTSSPSNLLTLNAPNANALTLFVGPGTGEYSSIRGKYGAGNDYAQSEIRFINADNPNGRGALAFAVGTNSTTEHMRITYDGKVGIGTTSPGAPLEVIGTAGTISARATTGVSSQTLQIYNNGTDSYIDSTAYGAGSGGGIVFRRNGSGEMGRWDTSGRLLVGTSTSRAVQDFTGNGPESLIQIEATNSNAIMSIISAGTADAGRAGTLSLGRHRNATVGGTPTIVQSGDTIGAICFAGGDGTDMLTKGAAIACQVDGTPGADDMPGRLVFSTTADGASSPTERLRITSAGLVGIGTNAPAELMQLRGSGATRLLLSSADNTTDRGVYFGTSDNTVLGYIKQEYSTGTFEISSGSGAYSSGIGFRTGGVANRVVIDSSGRVGIGIASPAVSGLTIESASSTQGIELSTDTGFASGPTIRGYYRSGSSYRTLGITGSQVIFGIQDVEKARIDSSGRLLVGTSTNLSSAGGVQIYNSSPFLIGCKADNNPTQGAVLMGMGGFSQSGAVFAEAAVIRCESGGSTSSGNHPGQIIFGTTATGTSSTERMRITSAGNVGIGATNPSSLLELSGVSNPQITLDGTTTSGYRGLIFAYDGTGFGQIGQNVQTGELIIRSGESGQTGYFINFSVNGSDAARIDSSGRLLVGTSTAGAGTADAASIVGSALTQSTGLRSLSSGGTLDLDLLGTGIVGHLYVSSVLSSNAAARTNTVFFITTRLGNNTVITALNSAGGSTDGRAFTITNPSGNIFRFTDTSSSACNVSMCFVGSMTS
jgi:hypothetical protein